MIKYQPKGGMCATCKKKHTNCSTLDFSTMQVIEKPDDKTRIVKCSFYDRTVG